MMVMVAGLVLHGRDCSTGRGIAQRFTRRGPPAGNANRLAAMIKCGSDINRQGNQYVYQSL